MANIGQIIENKYEILKRIGKGGMSEVYLAMDRSKKSKRRRATKIMR